MSERSALIGRLLSDPDYRANYIRAKLEVLIPSQLRALRLRQDKTQPELAQIADMKQSRISAMETPGRVNFNLDTLVRMAAALNVGITVKFIPFSEMLAWENDFGQDTFNVTQLANDVDFLQPATGTARRRARRKRIYRRIASGAGVFQAPIAASATSANRYIVPLQPERAQMKLQFETLEPPPAQSRLADVITLPKRSDSVLNDLLIPKAAAAAGASAGRIYGR